MGEDALSTIPLGRNINTIMRSFPANLIPNNVNGFDLRSLVVFFVIAVVFKLALDYFLKTKSGLLLRATGTNQQFVSTLAKAVSYTHLEAHWDSAWGWLITV